MVSGSMVRISRAITANDLLPPKQDILRLVDAGGKIRRAALIRVKFHHQLAVRGADLILARSLLETKDLEGLVARHADFAAAWRPCLLPRRPSRALLAPARRAPVDIGLDQGGTLRVGDAQLLEQGEEIGFAQRRQYTSCEPAFQTTSLHLAAVMVEHHF